MTHPGKKIEQAVFRSVHDQLAPYGFLRRGNSCIKHGDGIVIIVSFEKSQWGRQFYLETGIIISELPPLGTVKRGPNPKLTHGHIRLSAETLNIEWESLSSQMIPLNQWLDFENDLTLDERIDSIREFVQTRLISFLEQCNSIDSLRGLYQQQVFRRAIILHHAARSLFKQ